MIAWHVTTHKRFRHNLENDGIKAPVRAWKNIEDAEKFSIQTGRKLILRIKLPDDTPTLEGHKGNAVIYNRKLPLVGY